MILTNRWRFFDKTGNSMNLNPLLGVEAVVIDPAETGFGADLLAYTDVTGSIIHVEIKNGGQNYSSATYVSFQGVSYRGEATVIWDTDPSNVTLTVGTITAFTIPTSSQNAGFPYPNMFWNGENYFEKVSTGLIESEQIFVLEEVIDSATGEIAYTYPRMDEYGPYTFTSYEGDGTYMKFIQPNHPIKAGMEIRLYGGSPYDGTYTVTFANVNTFYVDYPTAFPVTAPPPGVVYGIPPKIGFTFIYGDDEIFYYTVEYNVDYPIIHRGSEIYFSPDNGTASSVPDTFPSGNAEYIRTVDSANLRQESIQVNLGVQADYEGIFLRSLTVSDITLPYSPKILTQLAYRAEVIGEDERLSSMLENFGQRIGLGEETIFRDSDVNEDLPDYQLLNQKRKELLLEYANIFPYMGSYKGLVNVVNWFGYPDLRIKEYWLNVDKNDQYFGRYKQTQIPLQLKNKGTSLGVAESAALLPNSVYKKTNLFGLYYDITRENGEFDEFGVPTTEDAFVFTNEEVLIKLFSLKRYLREKFLPLNAQIVDIVGEGIYFEKYAVNAWKDEVNIFSIQPTNTADFFAVNKNVLVRDLRILEDSRLLPDPADATSINQYYSTWDVLSIDVASGGGGFTSIPQLTIVGDSVSPTVCIVKLKAEPQVGVIPSQGGSGYAVGDIITFGGGVYDSPIRAIVTSVSGTAVATFDIIPGPNQGSNYSVLPPTFDQAYVTTIITFPTTTYAPGLGSGFEIDSTAITYTVDSVRLNQRGLGYINQPTYLFTPTGLPVPVLTLNLKELQNNNLIGYFGNYDGNINLNDSPNIPVGAILDLECTSFKASWDDASPYTWKSIEGSEEATISPIVSYLPAGTGQVIGFTIVNGGTGYKTAPTITITGGGGFGAAATCTILNGSVNSITLISGGSGYIDDPVVKVDGGITNTLYSWENIGKGDYYEMEWHFLLRESPQNQQFEKRVRGSVGTLEKYQVMLPYIGKYDVELYLYDTDNNFTNEYKNLYVNVDLPKVDFSYITRYSDCRDTWDEFGAPPPHPLPSSVTQAGAFVPPIPVSVNDSTMDDTPVSWDEMFARWINPIYVDTNWDDANVRWSSLETSEIDTLNNYTFPPCLEYPIERLSPYDVSEGPILSFNLATNTIVTDEQILRPQLEPGDRIYLRRDLNIFEYQIATVSYSSTSSISPIVGVGTGYVTALNVPTIGGTGFGLTVDIVANPFAPFNITSVTLNNSGVGYSTGDVITINQLSSGLNATFTVLSATPTTTTITTTAALPNGLNLDWDVLREIEGIIEIPGNAIYDAVNNINGFKIGNYIKIKGADDIPKVKRIPVTSMLTNSLTGLYQTLPLGAPYVNDTRFAEVNEIGQLYKLRDFHLTNGNLNWNSTLANSVWDLYPNLEGPYPGLPSDWRGKLLINRTYNPGSWAIASGSETSVPGAYLTGGYLALPTTGGSGTGLTASVNIDGGGNLVLPITITSAGTGYTIGDTITIDGTLVGGLPSQDITFILAPSTAVTSADPISEIRPGFTIITVYVLDPLGNLVYEQRLRTIHIYENTSDTGPIWGHWAEPANSRIVEIDVEAIDRGRLSEFNAIASVPGSTVWCEYEYATFPTRVENTTYSGGNVNLEMNFNTHPPSANFDSTLFPPSAFSLSENSNWFYDHGIVSGDFSMKIINTGISTVTGNTLVTVSDPDFEIGRSSGSFVACSRDFDEDYAEQRLGTLILKWMNFNENNWTQFCSQTWDTLSYHENIFCGWILYDVAPNGRIQFNDEPIFEFQTITGLLTVPYSWRFAYEELISTDNSGLVKFYYKFDPANTLIKDCTQVAGDTFITLTDVTNLSVGDTMIGLGIPFNASISLIIPIIGGFLVNLVEEDGITPIVITETLTQRVEFLVGTSAQQRILATAKSPGADSLGYLQGTNGVFFYDDIDLGPVTIAHTFPLGNMGYWLTNALVGGTLGGRDRLILRYPNLQTYFYEGLNPSGEPGWYPSANLNYLYDSTQDIWQSYRLPYERSICGSWSYEETKIGYNEVRVPTGASVLFVPDNCKIAGKTRFRWRISEQFNETEYTNLVETIDEEIMWTFTHSGRYNVELEVIDTNGNVGIREKKQFITVYDEN